MKQENTNNSPAYGETNVRTFIADYHDGEKYFNIENDALVPPGMSVAMVVANIIRLHEAKGRTVYHVYEVLDGYTDEQLAKMDRTEARQHVQTLYLDLSKERIH